MAFDYEVIVVGSGFGGSVAACRLAEAGINVCVLERGRRYRMGEFPRRLSEFREAFWDPKDSLYGMYDLRSFENMDVLTCAGLGGGSLIYANVLLPMPEEWFDEYWPKDIQYAEFRERYQQVWDMMDASPYPFDREPYNRTAKTKAHEDAAKAAGGEFVYPRLAVNFSGPPGQQAPNKHGALQSSCTLIGECDIGCNIHAKNTLDLNYLFVAEKHGADIKPDHQVTMIRPLDEGYAIEGMRLENGQRTSFSLQSRYVVLSAGAMGSTELLLRYQRESGKELSPLLGHRVCGNGDFMSYIWDVNRSIEPTYGTVITAGAKFTRDDPDGPLPKGGFFIEDAGFPQIMAYGLEGAVPRARMFWELGDALVQYVGRKLGLVKEKRVGDNVADIFASRQMTEHVHVLLGMGRDVPDGVLWLDEKGDIQLHWELKSSRPYYDAVARKMKEMGDALGGKTQVNPIWLLKKVITVHPLGGCPMGESFDTGVVDSFGKVFDEPGIYVADGSIIPSPVGSNPSLTIAALAERIAEGMVKRLKASA